MVTVIAMEVEMKIETVIVAVLEIAIVVAAFIEMEMIVLAAIMVSAQKEAGVVAIIVATAVALGCIDDSDCIDNGDVILPPGGLLVAVEIFILGEGGVVEFSLGILTEFVSI